MPTTIVGALAVRAASASDAGILREIFANSRDEFALLPGSTEAIGQLVDLQYAAQSAQYRAAHPAAEQQLITLDGQPIGQLITEDRTAAIDLVDLAILDTHRGKGIGSAVLRELCDRADHTDLPVELHVWAVNAGAIQLYERHGFRPTAESNDYLAMRRDPRQKNEEAA